MKLVTSSRMQKRAVSPFPPDADGARKSVMCEPYRLPTCQKQLELQLLAGW